jgi:hypothetical protein
MKRFHVHVCAGDLDAKQGATACCTPATKLSRIHVQVATGRRCCD